MDLKNYIKSVIMDITEAVSEAQENIKGMNAVINPPTKSDFLELKDGKRKVQNIMFEVLTDVSDTQGGKRGISVAAGVFSLGGEKDDTNTNKIGTSIKFEIPIALPSYKLGVDEEPMIVANLL